MKTAIRTAVSAAALFMLATAASAADLPIYEGAPVVSVPSFSWTGFYVGATAGYAFGDRDVTTSGKDPATRLNVANRLRPPSIGIDSEGFTVGGTLGYNVQLENMPVVFGLEADIAYTDLSETSRYSTPPLMGPGSIKSRFKQEMELFGTVRGRLGYAFGQFMVYGTGGLAYGDVKTSARFFNNSAGGGALGFKDSKSGLEFGYTVGGGVEYAITENISVKTEYLYYDLGDTKLNVNRTAAAPAGQTGYKSKFENDGHIVRAGVNYRF
jgi:outer membrane immunogenic protein